MCEDYNRNKLYINRIRTQVINWMISDAIDTLVEKNNILKKDLRLKDPRVSVTLEHIMEFGVALDNWDVLLDYVESNLVTVIDKDIIEVTFKVKTGNHFLEIIDVTEGAIVGNVKLGVNAVGKPLLSINL